MRSKCGNMVCGNCHRLKARYISTKYFARQRQKRFGNHPQLTLHPHPHQLQLQLDIVFLLFSVFGFELDSFLAKAAALVEHFLFFARSQTRSTGSLANGCCGAAVLWCCGAAVLRWCHTPVLPCCTFVFECVGLVFYP